MEEDHHEYRAFGGIDDNEDDVVVHSQHNPNHNHQSNVILQTITENIIGENTELLGPFGSRPCVYADWTASGRLLQQVETYLNTEVYPLYGNTHSSASRTGHQSTSFRHESRQIIAQAVNAHITGKAAVDMVLFTGNGTTSAVNKLVHCLELHHPSSDPSDITLRPVVFTSSYEHHSNLLPWRESEADVVTIKLSRTTGVCLDHLAQCLQLYENRKLKIGAFSAASNVTGLLTDVDSVSILMHKAGGLAFFDYATAAPYVKIDMNPVLPNSPDAQFVYKDAIYFSGHKFIGGPGSSGILIAKKRIIPSSNEVPASQGGGTVFYVTDTHQRYLSNRVEREEAGTPGIIGDIRIGLAFRIKQLVGTAMIHDLEMKIAHTVHSRLQSNPAIHLLGHPRDRISQPTDAKHLPLVSFLIQPSGCNRLLHHNFVSALLNDLFGIQSRGGCMCAGPYSQWLLGLCDAVTPFNSDAASSCCFINDSIENALLDKQEVIRPGYTRLSFPYFTPEEKIEYILKAIEFVAEYGVLFLQYYRYNHKTGEWAHSTHLTKFPERKWLSHFDLLNPAIPSTTQSTFTFSPQSYTMFLDQAKAEAVKILEHNQKKIKKMKSNSSIDAAATADHSLSNFDILRWFVLASDFPGSVPNIPEPGTPYISQDLKGALKPNAFFYNSTHHLLLDQSLDGNRTPYAQMRDQKFASSSHLAKRFPRYMNNEHLIGLKTKLSSSSSTSTLLPSTSTTISTSTEFNRPLVEDQKIQKTLSLSSSLPSQSIQIEINEHQQNEPLPLSPPSSSLQQPQQQGLLQPGSLGGSALSFNATESIESNPSKPKSITIPKKILKAVGQAIGDWAMIEEGDRLLLGLSGGKDSLALLHILLHVQKKAPINFTLACATVDPQTESFDPSPLIPYVQSLGVTYHYLSEPIVEMARSKLQGDSLCAFCSRFKRGLLYSCCRNNGYNKLVLAQHLDDLAESFIMSSLHNGQIRTMKANYRNESDGIEVNIIRPLVYVRESETRDFSLSSSLPVINENCPACFEQPKERARIKKLLSQEETMVPALFHNLRKALLPFMDENIYVEMKSVCNKIEERSRKRVKYEHHNERKSSKRGEVGGVGPGGGGEGGGEEEGDGNEHERGEIQVQGINTSTTTTSTTFSCGPNDTSQLKCQDDYCIPCYELA